MAALAAMQLVATAAAAQALAAQLIAAAQALVAAQALTVAPPTSPPRRRRRRRHRPVGQPGLGSSSEEFSIVTPEECIATPEEFIATPEEFSMGIATPEEFCMGNASPVWSSIPNSLGLFAAAPGLDISACFYETTAPGLDTSACFYEPRPAAYKDAAISAPGLDISACSIAPGLDISAGFNDISNISWGLDECAEKNHEFSFSFNSPEEFCIATPEEPSSPGIFQGAPASMPGDAPDEPSSAARRRQAAWRLTAAAPGLDISNISNISCGLDESAYEPPGLLERFFWDRVMRELLQHHSETSIAATSAEDCLRTAFGFETPISASSAARFLRNVQSVCESDFAEPVCESDDDVASNISWNSCGHDIESTVNE